MKIDYLPDVECDIREAVRFYDSLEPGLGKRAAQHLWNDLLSLESFGGIHSQRHGFHRMVASKPFPFLVFYRIERGVAIVYGVFDGRRDPAKIVSTLHRRSEPIE